MGVDALIDAVPEVKALADLSGEQIVNIGSQDMNDKVWLTLAKKSTGPVIKRTDLSSLTAPIRWRKLRIFLI